MAVPHHMPSRRDRTIASCGREPSAVHRACRGLISRLGRDRAPCLPGDGSAHRRGRPAPPTPEDRSMTPTLRREATAATIGGALWALLPVVFGLAPLEDTERGSLAFVAVTAAAWLFAVLPLALLLAGIAGLRRSLGDDAGRLGLTGLVVTAVGLAAMLA